MTDTTVRHAVADVLLALANRVRRGPNPTTTLSLTTPDPDSASAGTIRTLVSLPTESIPLHVVEICKYLDQAGDEAFVVRTGGSMSRSEFVGTVEAGKLIGLDIWPAQ